MNKTIRISLVSLLFFAGTAVFVYAQDPAVPPVDVENRGFRLVICDGPTPPPLVDTPQFRAEFRSEAGHEYVPCNFRYFMIQTQYLINVMITLGVLVAIIGCAYAGYLYVTGVEKNISKAKEIFPKLGLGFILMLTAWFIVYEILRWLTGSTGYLTGAGLSG